MPLQYLTVDEKAESGNLPDPFGLRLPFDTRWRESRGNRAMVVVETVPSCDLDGSRRLLGAEQSRSLVFNTLSHAVRSARRYAADPTPAMEKNGFSDPSWKFGFVNFNDRRWFGMEDKMQDRLAGMAAERVRRIAKRMKPDTVIVLGDGAASRLTDFGDNCVQYRGRPTRFAGTDIPAVSTIDVTSVEPSRNVDDDSAMSYVARPNLLGHASRNIVTGLLGTHPHSVSDVAPKAELVQDMAAFREMIDAARSAPAVALDSETTSLHTSRARVLSVQVAVGRDFGWVLPVYHPDNPWSNRELRDIRSGLRGWLGEMRGLDDTDRYVIGQNIGYDMRILMRWLGIRYWHLPVWDLMAGEFMLDENIKLLKTFGSKDVFKLPQIAAYYDNDHFQRARFSKDDRSRFADAELAPDSPAAEYGAADVQIPFAVHEEQLERAGALAHGKGDYRDDYRRVMLKHMSTMVRVTSCMRYRGTQMDTAYALKIMAGTEELARLRAPKLAEFRGLRQVKQANALVRRKMGVPDGGFFKDGQGTFALDMGKPEHKEVLFLQVAGLKPLKKGKSGKPSFDKKFLERYRAEECVRVFTELKDIDQLQSFFVKPFVKAMSRPDNVLDGRIHPDFGFVNTFTGRSNSTGPSLQQIAQHSEIAKYIKRMLVTRPGYLHYEGDYSQCEVRCLALLSGDTNLRAVFENSHEVVMQYRMHPTAENFKRVDTEGDPHKINYSFFTGVPILVVTKSQRQDAKGIVFGVMYGMGDESLGVEIGKSKDEAGELRGRFYAEYPDAERYMIGQAETAQANLYTVSPIGRRRNLFAYMSTLRQLRSAQDRRAQNSEIQGLASDICYEAADLFAYNLKVCMMRIRPRLARRPYIKGGIDRDDTDYLPFGPNAIVHDSIKGEASFGQTYLHMHLLEHSMTKGMVDLMRQRFGMEIDVPFDVELDVGSSWADKTTWQGGAKELDRVMLGALEAHRDLHGRAVVPNPASTLERMKDSYLVQKKILDLDNVYPLPHPLPLAA